MAVNGAELSAFAQQFTGTKYAWGGNSLTNGVDCSGLVQQVYKHFGINLPRTTYAQIGVGKSVGMNELQAGDLIFFDTDPNRKSADHVGIYIGNGMMVHSPAPGKSVEVASLKSGYYQSHLMGARRVSGIQGGGSAGTWSGTDTHNLSPEELASQYGWSYAFLNSNPTLKKLFSQAVGETWSAAQFAAHLDDTDWWKKNSSTMRQTIAEKATDPATYNAKLQAAKIKIEQLSAEVGASIPHNKLDKIAEQSIQTAMDDNLLRNTLGQYVTFQKNGSTLNGEAGQYEHDIRQYAYSQGVKLNNQTIKNQAQLIVRKLATVQDFRSQVAEQAASLYPSYAEQIKGGQTMMDIASPYIQQMSQDLEIPGNSITLDDPLIKRALNGLDANGKPTGLDTASFEQAVRNDSRWSKTKTAQDQALTVGHKVLSDMGLT